MENKMPEEFDSTPRKFFITGRAKSIDRENRTMVIIATERIMDRDGDIIEPLGADVKNYMLNPVILAFHDLRRPPIAKALDITIDEQRVTMTIQFKNTGEAVEIFNDYVDGFMNTWSMGFVAKRDAITEIWDDNNAENGKRLLGYHVKEWELIEVSAVPVPANPMAITRSKTLKKFFSSYENEPEKQYQTLTVPKDISATVTIDGYKDTADVLHDTFEKTALKKSILERIASNKADVEIVEVEQMGQAGMKLECTALDQKNGKVSQARIEKLTFYIPTTQKQLSNDETKRPVEVDHQIEKSIKAAQHAMLMMDLEE